MKTNRSAQLFAAAQSLIPGGVNSPVRAFRSVGGQPLFIKRAKGPYLYDVDKNRYLDYVLSWGPMILGHAHPRVIQAVIRATKNGTSFGTPCESEIQLASLITQAIPSLEQVRLVNSGTEAVMSAIRVARGFTKREGILKFEGCYHGHADHLLVKAGSGVATLGIPDSLGVPASFARHTFTAPYNDIKAIRRIIEKHAKKLAAIIVEPVAGNMGVVLPHPEFLPFLRDITKKHDILLIFDEVITGFRVHFGGAQSLYGVTPDLTCLGKNHWRRATDWSLWRSSTHYANGCPGGARLPSWNLGGKSRSGYRWPRNLATAQIQKGVSRFRREGELPGRGTQASCSEGQSPLLSNPGWFDVRRVFHKRPGCGLFHGQTIGHQKLCKIFSWIVKPRGLPSPIPIRGSVRINGPYFRTSQDNNFRCPQSFSTDKSILGYSMVPNVARAYSSSSSSSSSSRAA